MEKNLRVVRKSSLFQGLEEAEIIALLDCLRAREAKFDKGQFVFRSGDTVSSIGLILSGCVHLIEEDFWGNRTILNDVGTGQVFAESYACVKNAPLQLSVLAVEQTKIMFLDIGRVLQTCSSACGFHTRIVANLLGVLAQKNLMVTEKLEHISKRTTREKIMSYLSAESHRHQSMEFDIPFNRQDLSDFLAVDRSALSKELARLHDDGVLDFKKNHFILR